MTIPRSDADCPFNKSLSHPVQGIWLVPTARVGDMKRPLQRMKSLLVPFLTIGPDLVS